MKDAKGTINPTFSKLDPEDMSAADKILSASGLSLSLEPIADDPSSV